MNDLWNQLIVTLEEMLASGESIPDSLLDEISDLISPSPSPIPEGTDLLWHIANGDPEAFINYLQTVPDPAINQLLNNPSQLNSIINDFSRQFPPDQPVEQQGIQKAPLNSSNIWGFSYDPKSGELKVKFQGGSTYEYEGVPPHIFNVFQRGAIPAKTTGQNAYGSWWRGKNPSLGAAFYDLIRQGGYPYQRIG